MGRFPLLALGIALALGPGAASADAAVTVPAPRFARLPAGWHELSSGPALLTRTGASASAVALSWPYRQSRGGWASALPRDGMAVSVLLIRRAIGSAAGTGVDLCRVTPHLAAYPLVRRLPLRLPRTTAHTLEGAPRVPEYRVFGRIGESYEFEVRVDVADPHPSARLLAAAQRVVAAIRFPRWPSRTHC